MLPLLIAQALYALVAWSIAVSSVARISSVAGASSKLVARSVRELRAQNDAARWRRFAEALGTHRLAALVRLGADADPEVDLVDAAQEILDAVRPRVQLLRALATLGTTSGLLTAILALRFGLGDGAHLSMEHAAARALDSAVLGFVTALPCWTAVAIGRRQLGRAFEAIDGIVRALEPGSNGVDATQVTK